MTIRARLAIASLMLLLSACGSDHSDNTDATTPPVPSNPADPAGPISAVTLAAIDSYVQTQMAAQHIPGLALVVSMNGKPVLERGYGYANVDTGAAVTPSTVFRIASITKQFTATGIMMLVQEGKIGLDDPVSRYFSTAPAGWSGITVRHLLNHTSGLVRDMPTEVLGTLQNGPLPSMDALVAIAGKLPLATVPGAAFSYSNVGYHLLGFLIEKVSGQHYAEFLQQRLFVPLGMTSADVIRTTRPVASMATGYGWDGAAFRPASTRTMLPGLIEAEGGLQLHASDLAKWDAALLTGRFLTKDSLAQMWAPARLNNGTTVAYGFGWTLGDINGHAFISHDGALEGFTSQFARHTASGLSVIVLNNQQGATPTRIAARIGALIKPELDWVIATDPQPAAGALLRALIDEAKQGKVALDGRFAPELRAALTNDDLALYTDYFGTWAALQQVGYIDTRTINGQRVARYLVRSSVEEAVIGIALNASGQATWLGLLVE